MDDKNFWKTIALLDWDSTGNDNAVLEPAIKFLSSMKVNDIFLFEDILAEKLHALDTRQHCKACYEGELDPDNGDDYISADDFLYSRCVVVANGEEFFSQVIADPSKMPKDMEFEAILSLAANAFDRKTGEEFDHVSPISYESFRNLEGWKATKTTRPGKFTGENIPLGNRRPT